MQVDRVTVFRLPDGSRIIADSYDFHTASPEFESKAFNIVIEKADGNVELLYTADYDTNTGLVLSAYDSEHDGPVYKRTLDVKKEETL
jgi:hypothetical protein